MTAAPLRVVVYAEGPAESRGLFTLPPRAGETLADGELGPAHVLVRATLANVAPRRARAIVFEEPLRLGTGREARGNDLLRRSNLRRLLTWVTPFRPHLAVLLVDEDGDGTRLGTLKSHLDPTWQPPVAIGVAVREFESWLVTDMRAVRTVLSQTIDEPAEPESMAPGRAKELLRQWAASNSSADAPRLVRRRIVEAIDVELLARSSGSFRRFRDELRSSVDLAI